MKNGGTNPMAQPKPIPEGYHNVQPYLIFNKCADALDYYVKAFGAKERMRFPAPDGKIGHAEIQIGDSVIMMADESPQMDAFSVDHYGGSPVTLMIYTENCDAMYAQALATGATSLREPTDQFYGDRTAGVLDPFGYKWWIATHVKDLSIEEMMAHTTGA
jgi:PhnB protein